MNNARALTISAIYTCLCLPAYGDSPWQAFVESPDASGLTRLTAAMATASKPCNRVRLPGEGDTRRLLHEVKQGNEAALRAARLIQHCWDGGDLEDFYRAAGECFEARPGTFLSIVGKSRGSESDLEYMVTMLPLEVADNPGAAIDTLNRRITAVNSVKDITLVAIKQQVLRLLEQERSNRARDR